LSFHRIDGEWRDKLKFVGHRERESEVTVRKQIRSILGTVDRSLGLREWLREANGAPAVAPVKSDPFTSTAELRHPHPNTVIDIGGSHGQFATEVIRDFPNAVIYSFEPIPQCFAELSTLSQTHPQLKPIQLALSNEEGQKEFNLSRFQDSSSFQQMLPRHLEAWPHTETEARIQVQMTRLDRYAQRMELRAPIFAKMDVQGHELAVIEGGRETLARCQRVMMECNFAPLYQGQPTFIELYSAMTELGFLFDGFISPLRHPRTLELLSADLIFYKPVDELEAPR
jgi:FkbM family methyltransferase